MIGSKLWRRLICCLFFIQPMHARPQGQDSSRKDSSWETVRLPVPLSEASALPACLADTIAALLQEGITEMGRDDLLIVVSVDDHDKSLDRLRKLKMIVDWDRLGDFSEALVISDIAFVQTPGRRDQLAHEYFDWIARQSPPEDVAVDRAGAVRTEISVTIEYFQIPTGLRDGFSRITAVHSGGRANRSAYKSLEKLQQKLRLELQRIYGLAADLDSAKGRIAKLPIGVNQGVHENMDFSIISPDRLVRHSNETTFTEGGIVGLATVAIADTDYCLLNLDRQWGPLSFGSWAMPYANPVFSFYLHLQPPLYGSFSQYSLYLQGNPLNKLDWGIGVNVIRVKDSFGDDDLGVGFGVLGRYRLLNRQRLDFGLKIGADVGIPFRKDDDNNMVSAALFSMQAAVVAEMVLAFRTDMVWNAGYRWSLKADTWDYSMDDESFPACWDNQAPSVGNSGFFLAVGLRYSLF